MENLVRVTRNGLTIALMMVSVGACSGDIGPAARSTASQAPSQTSAPAVSSTASSSSGEEFVLQTNGSIWVQAPDEDIRNVASAVQADNQHPDWSPDGTQIAFEANYHSIWTVGHDGTGERELFTCEEPCADVYEPAWSPDGTTLAFMRILRDGAHTASSQLMSLDLESGKTTVLHEDAAGDVWENTPRWSRDGTRLVLEHDVFASNLIDEDQILSTELRLVDTATGTATPLKGTLGAQEPDWSPTGDLIVFTDGANLFTIHADGSHKKRLTRFKAKKESAIQPTFTPDGTGAVFTWVKGVKNSGTESTVAAIAKLSDGSIVAIDDARGATHTRIRPPGE